MGFLIGAFCSLAAGYIGMRIAVLANTRTTQAATQSRSAAMRVAFNGGAVTGLLVVGLALLAVGTFYTLAKHWMGPDLAVKSLVGLALGASLISVFARLGGGIYTKAADVGADLVGKSKATSRKMIRGIRLRLRTTSAIMWAIAAGMAATFSRPTPLAWSAPSWWGR